MRHAASLRVVLLALLFLLALPAWDAVAQTRISPGTIQSNTSLNNAQNQEIQQYVTHYAQQLLSGTDRQVAEARQALLEPVRQVGVTNLFRRAYSVALSGPIAAAMDSDRVMIRLNAMIVINQLIDQGSATLALNALSDKSPAVRYWAARAVARMAEQRALSPEQQLAVLNRVDRIIQDEFSQEVLEQVFNAMNEMDVPRARADLLKGLNERLKFHVGRDRELYRAEQAAIRRLQATLVRARIGGQNVDEEIKELARICARYLIMVSEQMSREGGSLTAELLDDRRAMLDRCNEFLQYAFEQFRPAAARPEHLRNAIQFGNWRQVALVASDWRNVLRQPPFSFTPAQLEIIDQ